MIRRALKKLAKHPTQLISAIANDPVEVWIRIHERYDERRERQTPIFSYEADGDWERHLHELLGIPWPCNATAEFDDLWPIVIEAMRESGIRVGPMSFGTWNDGDAGLVRAIWCLTAHLKPQNVIETGVGHGLTSRFVLEGLERQRAGHLWSIDLPPLDPDLKQQVGVAVGKNQRARWTYIEGSSRRRLQPLLSKVDPLNLFIHDSLHSERNVRFEMDRAWANLKPGGAIVVDDIDANWGFHSFGKAHTGHRSLICESEPLHPDLRRPNKKGFFGIVLKDRAEIPAISNPSRV
ncbi:MAG: class I SAM-dependent methyltransferase [Candidatus Sulfotelmatobacter sp.]